ncbi:MAG: hypothetical protein AAF998_15080 [Bacteroidota bacterium]
MARYCFIPPSTGLGMMMLFLLLPAQFAAAQCDPETNHLSPQPLSLSSWWNSTDLSLDIPLGQRGYVCLTNFETLTKFQIIVCADVDVQISLYYARAGTTEWWQYNDDDCGDLTCTSGSEPARLVFEVPEDAYPQDQLQVHISSFPCDPSIEFSGTLTVKKMDLITTIAAGTSSRVSGGSSLNVKGESPAARGTGSGSPLPPVLPPNPDVMMTIAINDMTTSQDVVVDGITSPASHRNMVQPGKQASPTKGWKAPHCIRNPRWYAFSPPENSNYSIYYHSPNGEEVRSALYREERFSVTNSALDIQLSEHYSQNGGGHDPPCDDNAESVSRLKPMEADDNWIPLSNGTGSGGATALNECCLTSMSFSENSVYYILLDGPVSGYNGTLYVSECPQPHSGAVYENVWGEETYLNTICDYSINSLPLGPLEGLFTGTAGTVDKLNQWEGIDPAFHDLVGFPFVAPYSGGVTFQFNSYPIKAFLLEAAPRNSEVPWHLIAATDTYVSGHTTELNYRNLKAGKKYFVAIDGINGAKGMGTVKAIKADFPEFPPEEKPLKIRLGIEPGTFVQLLNPVLNTNFSLNAIYQQLPRLRNIIPGITLDFDVADRLTVGVGADWVRVFLNQDSIPRVWDLSAKAQFNLLPERDLLRRFQLFVNAKGGFRSISLTGDPVVQLPSASAGGGVFFRLGKRRSNTFKIVYEKALLNWGLLENPGWIDLGFGIGLGGGSGED